MRPRLPVLALLVALPACTAAGSDDAAVPTTREQLSLDRTFHVDSAGSRASLHATVDFPGRGSVDTDVDLMIRHSSLVVRASDDDLLTILDATLAYDDVPLPPFIYPGDLVLTDLHVTLTTPIACTDTLWSDDAQIAFCTDMLLPLTLEWSLVIDGTAHPLAPQTLDGLHGTLMVTPYHVNALALWVGAASDGVAWHLGELVTLDNVDVDLDAHAGSID